MPRLEFTSPTKREAFARSRGVCECHRVPWLKRAFGCGAKLGAGNIFYEHINPDNIRPDNSLDNCAALVKTCWREKTDHYDRKIIAKNNHTRDPARGIKPRSFQKISGSKGSGIRQRMDGTIWHEIR